MSEANITQSEPIILQTADNLMKKSKLIPCVLLKVSFLMWSDISMFFKEKYLFAYLYNPIGLNV